MSLIIKIILWAIATLILSAREPPQIELVNQGTIAGMYISRFRTKRIAAYLGIPYAQPPIGFRRLAPPEFVDVPSWEGVRNATEYPPDCMQKEPNKDDLLNRLNPHDELFIKLLESQMDEPRKREYAEDCLYLNVYVPDEPKVEGYPTMVWFHGGDFVRGSPHDINPFQLVLKHKIIFVTVAYRLNIFGFFSTLDNEGPGNYGLMDQVAAMQWVQNNIEGFGGDKNNVCIFGHDAGAVSVGIHLISSASAGLFNKAIAMSGNVLAPRSVNIAKKMATSVDKIAYKFGCFRKPTFQLLDCLRNPEAQVFLDGGSPLAEWKPIVDIGANNISEAFISDMPVNLFSKGSFTQVPFLTGYTDGEESLSLIKSEGDENTGISPSEFNLMTREVVVADIAEENSSCFMNQYHILDAVEFVYSPTPPTTNETILRDLLIQFYMDKLYASPTYKLAKYMSSYVPVYVYRFDLKPFSDIANDGLPDWVGMPHNFDLIYTFGLPYSAKTTDYGRWDYRDKSISAITMRMWINFAWYSHPTNSGVYIQWEQFEQESPGFLIIDRQNFTMSTPATINYKALEFWSEFYPKVLEIGTKCCHENTEDSGFSITMKKAHNWDLLLSFAFVYVNRSWL